MVAFIGIPMVQIAVGDSFTLALTSDGFVYSWGAGNYGVLGTGITLGGPWPTKIPSISNITYISAGAFTAFAQNSTHLLGWGSNTNYELCTSPNTDKLYPTLISGIPATIVSISSGWTFTAMLDSNNTVWTCGENTKGQHGQGVATTYTTPQNVPGLSGVTKIKAGPSFVVVVTNKFESYAWGEGINGQLGLGTNVIVYSPKLVPLSNVTNIEASSGIPLGTASYWITSDGTIYGAGRPFLTGAGLLPTRVKQFDGGIGFSGGSTSGSCHHSLVIALNHTLIGVGANNGQFGVGETLAKPSPVVAAPSLLSVADVSSQDQHSLVLDGSKRVWAMGNNLYGQLGLGDNITRTVPTQIASLTNIVAISAGESFSMAVNSSQHLWSWGLNDFGQLGHGDLLNRTSPSRVSTPIMVQSVSSGAKHALFVSNDFNVYVVGKGTDGQLGTGSLDSSNSLLMVSGLFGAIKVSAGTVHSLVLMSNGSVFSFGGNTFGQLGSNDTISRSSPFFIPGLTGIIQVSAGHAHSLVLHSSGMVYAFGDNSKFQLCLGIVETSTIRIPTPIPNFVAKKVLASATHSLFIEAFPSYSCNGFAYDDVRACSARGSCVSQDVCSCMSGYSGNQCEMAICFGFPSNSTDVCRRRGSCNEKDMCTCNLQYSGAQCEIYSCSGKFSNDPAVCSGNGYCWEWNKCECYPGYAGTECETLFGVADSVYGSGLNTNGQLGINSTLVTTAPILTLYKNVIQVVASNSFSIALKSDGSLVATGSNTVGAMGTYPGTHFVPQTASGVPPVKMLSCGNNFCHAITIGGQVWVSGTSQLGLISPETTNTFIQNMNLNGSVFLAAGRSHALAILADRSIVSFGSNTFGALGINSLSPVSSTLPLQVVGLNQYGIYKVAAGEDNSFAILDDTSVFSWGRNNNGQLGLGSQVDQVVPQIIPNFSGVREISSGVQHTLALKFDGSVWAFGFASQGQLGFGDQVMRRTPSQIYFNGKSFNATTISASWAGSSLFVAPDNIASSFGVGSTGQLGFGDTNQKFSPVQVSLPGVISLSCKFQHTLWMVTNSCNGISRLNPSVCNGRGSCAETGKCTNCTDSLGDFCETTTCFGILSNSTSVCSSRGQCMTFDTCSCFSGYHGSKCSVSMCFGKLSNDTSVCNGKGTCLGPNICKCFSGFSGSACNTEIPSNAQVFATGNNPFGQFGLSYSPNGTKIFVPLSVPGIVSIQSGFGFIVLLTSNRTLLASGRNSNGQLGLGNTITEASFQIVNSYSDNITHLSCGDSNCIYTTTDGSVNVVGLGAHGQLGTGDTTDRLIYAKLSGISTAVVASVAKFHSLLLMKDGTVMSTGLNSEGQLGLGDYSDRTVFTNLPLSNIRDVSAGESHSIAVSVTGSVFVWGSNADGQLGLGDFDARIVPSKVLTLSNIKEATAGLFYSFFLTNSGTILACGGNSLGQLGLGHQNTLEIPTTIGSVSAVNKISAGFSNTSLAMTSSGVFGWGRNQRGQIGVGDDEDRSVPTFIPGIYPLEINNRRDFTLVLGFATCFGIASTSSTVCSGRGVCIGPNQCANCTSGYSGPQCDVLNGATNVNLTSSLANTVLSISNATTLNIATQTLSLTNTTINIAGTMNVVASTLNLVGTSINISPGAKLIIGANSIITGDPSSSLVTFGDVSVNLGSKSTSILVKINNGGQFSINGAGNVVISDTITQTSRATFTSLSANITCSGDLNIRDGFVTLGGSLTSKNITIADAFVRTPNTLNVKGSLNLNSTMLFEVSSLTDLNQLFVSESFKLYSTVIIKLSKAFTSRIGDELNIIPSLSDTIISGNFILIGGQSKMGVSASLETPQAISSDNLDISPRQGMIQRKKLKIVVSYSLGDEKSQCTYLGNMKNFEFNIMDKQVSMAMLLPVPSDSSNIGIGWSTNATFDINKLVVFNPSTVETYGNFLIDSVAKLVPQIFGVGPQYYYLNLVIDKDTLANQTHLFYFETNKNMSNLTNVPIETFAFGIGRESILDCANFVAPFRAEVYSPAGLGILLVFYFVLFLACLFYSILKVQPMVSRGISPYFILFFCFVQLLTEVRNYYYPTDSQASLCLFYAYLYYPAIQTCYIVILFYYIRYFLIINMNEMKNSIDNEGGQNVLNDVKRRIFLIKIFLSKWAIVAYLSSSYLLVNLLFTIVLASNRYVCSYNILLALKILHCIELILIYFVIMVSIFFDMGMNWKKLVRCQWINYLLYSDPFWFRSQIILFLVYLVYQFVADIVLVILTRSYIETITNYYTIAVLNTVSCVFLVLIDVLYPLVLTIWTHFNSLVRINITLDVKKCKFEWNIHRKYRQRLSVDKIGSALEDPIGYKCFLEFCKAEFSVENIQCWSDIQKYKKNPNEIKVKEIQVLYLMGAQSIMEVNIPGSIKSGLLEAIDRSVKEAKFDEHLFDDLEKSIRINLSDTYSRLTETNSFKAYEMSKNTQKELLEVSQPTK